MIPRNLQITGALVLLAMMTAAIYGVQLKRRDERNKQHATAPMPVSGEATTSKFRAMIAFDDDGVLSDRELSAWLPNEESARAKEMLRAVLHQYMKNPSSHPVPQGSDVRSVFVTTDGLCVVDLNSELVERHRSGMLVEQFTLLSLIETLAMNFQNMRQVKVLVDGKERYSLAGHADLSTIYDIGAIHIAAKEYAHR